MKNFKWVLIIPIVLFNLTAFSQVKFQEINNLDAFFQKARKEGKLVFLQFQSEDCQQCNKVADMALNSPLLSEKFNQNFVSGRINKSSLHQKAKEFLHFEIEYGSIFADASGQVILIQNSTTSNVIQYINWADEAISKSKEAKDIFKMREEYSKGQRSSNFLKTYIKRLREVGIYDLKLMDDYIANTLIDTLNQHNNILFIIEQGVSAGSETENFLGKNIRYSLRDSLWYTLDNNSRVKINHRVRNNTLMDAIYKKDKTLLRKLNNITYSHYSQNRQQGDYVVKNMNCEFYKKTKDTINYINSVVAFVENHLMKIDPEKLRQKQEDAKNKYFESTKQKIDTLVNRDTLKWSVTTSRRVQSDRESMQLNNFAYDIYKMSNDTSILQSAIAWSQRSMDLWKANFPGSNLENPAYLDTYAHLLYKMGRKDEAITWLEKAVEVQNKFKMPILDSDIKKNLELMKAGKIY